MYIPKYKRRRIIRNIITVAIIIVLLIVFNHIYYNMTKQEDLVKKMNRQELMYDSDGPFIMLSTKDNLIGYYIGTIPIVHYECYEYIEDGIYNIQYNEYDDSFEFLKKGSGQLSGSVNAHNNTELVNNFDGSIALVYSKEIEKH